MYLKMVLYTQTKAKVELYRRKSVTTHMLLPRGRSLYDKNKAMELCVSHLDIRTKDKCHIAWELVSFLSVDDVGIKQ